MNPSTDNMNLDEPPDPKEYPQLEAWRDYSKSIGRPTGYGEQSEIRVGLANVGNGLIMATQTPIQENLECRINAEESFPISPANDEDATGLVDTEMGADGDDASITDEDEETHPGKCSDNVNCSNLKHPVIEPTPVDRNVRETDTGNSKLNPEQGLENQLAKGNDQNFHNPMGIGDHDADGFITMRRRKNVNAGKKVNNQYQSGGSKQSGYREESRMKSYDKEDKQGTTSGTRAQRKMGEMHQSFKEKQKEKMGVKPTQQVYRVKDHRRTINQRSAVGEPSKKVNNGQNIKLTNQFDLLGQGCIMGGHCSTGMGLDQNGLGISCDVLHDSCPNCHHQTYAEDYRWKQKIQGQSLANWDVCFCALMGSIEDQNVRCGQVNGCRFHYNFVDEHLLHYWVMYQGWGNLVLCFGHNYMERMRLWSGLYENFNYWSSLTNWLPSQCMLTSAKSKGRSLLGEIKKGCIGAGSEQMLWEWRGTVFGGAGGWFPDHRQLLDTFTGGLNGMIAGVKGAAMFSSFMCHLFKIGWGFYGDYVDPSVSQLLFVVLCPINNMVGIWLTQIGVLKRCRLLWVGYYLGFTICCVGSHQTCKQDRPGKIIWNDNGNSQDLMRLVDMPVWYAYLCQDLTKRLVQRWARLNGVDNGAGWQGRGAGRPAPWLVLHAAFMGRPSDYQGWNVAGPECDAGYSGLANGATDLGLAKLWGRLQMGRMYTGGQGACLKWPRCGQEGPLELGGIRGIGDDHYIADCMTYLLVLCWGKYDHWVDLKFGQIIHANISAKNFHGTLITNAGVIHVNMGFQLCGGQRLGYWWFKYGCFTNFVIGSNHPCHYLPMEPSIGGQNPLISHHDRPPDIPIGEPVPTSSVGNSRKANGYGNHKETIGVQVKGFKSIRREKQSWRYSPMLSDLIARDFLRETREMADSQPVSSLANQKEVPAKSSSAQVGGATESPSPVSHGPGPNIVVTPPSSGDVVRPIEIHMAEADVTSPVNGQPAPRMKQILDGPNGDPKPAEQVDSLLEDQTGTKKKGDGDQLKPNETTGNNLIDRMDQDNQEGFEQVVHNKRGKEVVQNSVQGAVGNGSGKGGPKLVNGVQKGKPTEGGFNFQRAVKGNKGKPKANAPSVPAQVGTPAVQVANRFGALGVDVEMDQISGKNDSLGGCSLNKEQEIELGRVLPTSISKGPTKTPDKYGSLSDKQKSIIMRYIKVTHTVPQIVANSWGLGESEYFLDQCHRLGYDPDLLLVDDESFLEDYLLEESLQDTLDQPVNATHGVLNSKKKAILNALKSKAKAVKAKDMAKWSVGEWCYFVEQARILKIDMTYAAEDVEEEDNCMASFIAGWEKKR
ncbi:hypothetical protein E3N88_34189 [Mikania micrantha]|uniref:Uncharacterized protein n=1 Tax=Mikania micrantha TaxID=192012 RepID=A0A5N6MG79_9ASTR|nr:hypothetical protein E3N88_34189 [Mikania micrantha]